MTSVREAWRAPPSTNQLTQPRLRQEKGEQLRVEDRLGGSSSIAAWLTGGLSFFPWSWVLIPLLYTLPGLALLRFLQPRGLQLGSVATLSLGLVGSIALAPLLLLLSQIVGLRWNSLTVASYLLLSLLILLWPAGRAVRSWPAWRERAATVRHQIWMVEDRAAAGALALITIAALMVRLYAVRDLVTGQLGDAYQHTLIAQLIVDHGGLFTSWQPYAPLSSFTYHFGFHAQAAMVHWLTGIPVIQSVLITGQILNTAAIPLAFLLVIVLRGSPWAGVWAALMVAFVSALPAFYVSWGRYTQLTGQLILVGVVAAWINLADQPNWRAAALAALMTAAMLLTHYLVTVSAALFVFSYLVAQFLAERAPGRAVQRIGWAVATCLVALLLAAPWLLNVLNGYLVRIAQTYFTPSQVPILPSLLNLTAATSDTPPFTRGYMLFGALVGLGIAAWRRDWRMGVPLAWSLGLGLLVVPYVVGLPGSGMIDSLTALSALYLPIPTLFGYALASGQNWLVRQSEQRGIHGRWVTGGTLALMLGIVVWGSGWQAQIVDLRYRLVTAADLRAMAWIRQSTPTDARFVVNGVPAYSGTLVAGTDAGWWLPMLAYRQSILPPLTFGSEVADPPELYWEIVNRWALIRERPLSDARPVRINLTLPATLEVLRAAGVTHVYSGAQAFPGPEVADWIDTALLRASPDFELVYAQEGVEIFALRSP